MKNQNFHPLTSKEHQDNHNSLHTVVRQLLSDVRVWGGGGGGGGGVEGYLNLDQMMHYLG